jgi:fructoselysine-6-P-deglycase FrlB-like protein
MYSYYYNLFITFKKFSIKTTHSGSEVSFSRSGDSPDGVAVLEQAIRLYPDIAHLTVTCNSEARMIASCEDALRSCVIVLDDLVNDRGLAMTMSETVLGLRYGPMAALDRQTLFICFLSEERRKTLYARDIRSELGKKGNTGERLVVAPASKERARALL